MITISKACPIIFRPPRGFTFVEILVTCAILTILGLLLCVVIGNMIQLSSQATSSLSVNQNAREALDLIGRDLTKAALPWSRGTVNTTISNTLQFVVNPTLSGLPASPVYACPHTMFWQAPISRNQSSGDLAIVGYFVLSDLQTDRSKSRFQLRRVYIEPQDTTPTYANNYSIYSSPTTTPTFGVPTWLSVTNLANFGPTTLAADAGSIPPYAGWVADGVLAMWVRCLDRQNNPITQYFSVAGNASVTTNYQYDSHFGYYSSPYIYTSNVVPAYVEVGLVCIAPPDVAKLSALPAYSATTPNNFTTEIQAFAAAVRTNNPSVKSVVIYDREFYLYGSD